VKSLNWSFLLLSFFPPLLLLFLLCLVSLLAAKPVSLGFSLCLWFLPLQIRKVTKLPPIAFNQGNSLPLTRFGRILLQPIKWQLNKPSNVITKVRQFFTNPPKFHSFTPHPHPPPPKNKKSQISQNL
jgi:hypothetical protein